MNSKMQNAQIIMQSTSGHDDDSFAVTTIVNIRYQYLFGEKNECTC